MIRYFSLSLSAPQQISGCSKRRGAAGLFKIANAADVWQQAGLSVLLLKMIDERTSGYLDDENK